jgi:hypothetical protein
MIETNNTSYIVGGAESPSSAGTASSSMNSLTMNKHDSMLYSLALELAHDAADANAAAAAWGDDFVVISEFSEHEGPIALQLLPASAAKSVDVSEFVVKIMAVDVNRGSDSELGKFHKDSQVVCDVDLPLAGADPPAVARWSAYVHHLTLLDVNARGYVRPICLSYLSREPRKIAAHFLDLSREFSLAAETLKRGNYDLFRRDVERRIADLEFTRVRLAAPDNAISPPTSHGPTLDEHLDELRLVLARLRQTLATPASASLDDNDSVDAIASNAGTAAAAAAATSAVDTLTPPGVLISNVHKPHDETEADEAARSFGAELSELDLYENVVDDDVTRLADATSAAVRVPTHEQELRSSIDRKQTSTMPGGGGASSSSGENFSVRVRRPSAVSPIGAAVHSAMIASVESSRPSRSSSQPIIPTVVGFATAATSSASALTNPTTPSIAVAATTSTTNVSPRRSSASDASAQQESYKPQVIKSLQRADRFEERLRDLPTLCDAWHTPAIEQLKRTRRHFARPSIALSLERDDETLLALPSTLLSFGGALTLNFDLHADVAEPSAAPRDEFAAANLSSADTSERPAFLAKRAAARVGDGNPATAAAAAATDAEPMSRRHSMENLMLGDENGMLRSDVLTHLPRLTSPNQIECFGDALWSSSMGSGAGRGILRILRRCSFARHLVASLLRSRPVVIRGASRVSDVVRALVRAFAVFVPRGGIFDAEPDAAPAIVLWRGSSAPPLRLGDLATLRLVGVASEHALPSTIENHVSIYDVDEQTLKAPAYEGTVVPSSVGNSSSGGSNAGSYRQSPRRGAAAGGAAARTAAPTRVGGVGASHVVGVVDDMLSLHRMWPDEATYLAFVHHSLYELAAKACLYYHLCAVEPAAMARRSSSHTSFHGVESEEDDADHEVLSGTATPVHRPVRSSLARLSMQLLSGSSSFSAATTVNVGHDASNTTATQEEGTLSTLGSTPFSRSSARETFFRRMGVADCDIEIVVNLAEVVKLQQDTDRRPANAAPTLRLDYATCALFRNTTAAGTQNAVTKGRSPHSSVNRY